MAVDMLEVGVTLPVPAPWRRMLALLRTSVGDPLGGVVDPHITLIPPTRIAGADLLDFAHHVDKVAAATSPFRVCLAGAGSFRPVSDVVFAPVAAGADECAGLAALLRSGPVEVSLDHPFHPHVTAAQNVGASGLDRATRYLRDFTAEYTATQLLLSARTADNPAAPWIPVFLACLSRPTHPE